MHPRYHPVEEALRIGLLTQVTSSDPEGFVVNYPGLARRV
jgi:hypothetical protein